MVAILLFGIPAAIIAYKRGFASLRWLLALGLIGLIWVLCLDSANEPNIDEAEKQRRIKKADTVGAWLAWINVAIVVIFTIANLVSNS